jgi:hypothetical protein
MDQAATAGSIGRAVGGLITGSSKYGGAALLQNKAVALGFRMRFLSGAMTSTVWMGRANIATWDEWHIGIRGNISTTKFVAWSRFGSITSTISIDNAWHSFILFRDGATTYFAVDNEPMLSSANVYGNLGADEDLRQEAFQVENGANGGAISVAFRSVYTAIPTP